MTLTSIFITGDHNGRGFEVRVNGTIRWIPRALFEYFLELAIQIWATKSGYLFTQDALSTDGDEERTRQAIHRLRGLLGEYDLIANGCKSYRFNVTANSLEVDERLFEIPAGVLDPRIVNRLQVARERYRQCIT